LIGYLIEQVRAQTVVEELLNQIGWSARYFADRLGVDEHTVQKWKSGRSQGASYRIAMLYLELVYTNSCDVTTKNDGVFQPSEEHW
jgi:DNA-binding transcriptional regulator YiaG